MLRALAPATPVYHPDHQGNRLLAAEHKKPFGCVINQLIKGEQGKIYPLMCQDWSQPSKACSDTNTSHGIFRYRHIHYAVTSIFLHETLCGAKDTFWIWYPQTNYQNFPIFFKQLIRGFVDRCSIR